MKCHYLMPRLEDLVIVQYNSMIGKLQLRRLTFPFMKLLAEENKTRIILTMLMQKAVFSFIDLPIMFS